MEQETPVINWEHLTLSLDFFKTRGFRYVEPPWAIPESYIRTTFDDFDHTFTTKHGCLVGSAEQSLVYMRDIGGIDDGDYSAITPCFRNEPVIDRLSRPYFIKLETIKISKTRKFNNTDVERLVEIALMNFSQRVKQSGAKQSDLEPNAIKMCEDSYDIMLGGIEVGSYGVRTHNDISWVYGTGMAEPRFSESIRIMIDENY